MKWILILFLCWDAAYSFYENYHMSIGGDIAQIVVPNDSMGYYDVLQDPFGIGVLRNHRTYSNPNRYFVHWAASVYLLHVPILFQGIVDPLESVYLAIAFFKTLVQLGIIFLLASLITRHEKQGQLAFWVAAALITPLFQTWGFNKFMGIIDQSAIYSFFYAFPLLILLLYIYIFFQFIALERSLQKQLLVVGLLVIMSLPLALGGPLIPGVVLISASLLMVHFSHLVSGRKLNRQTILGLDRRLIIAAVLVLWISVLCLYSLYIGRANDLNNVSDISLWLRYLRIPEGIFRIVTTKLGLPILLISLGINFFLIHTKFVSIEKNNLLKTSRWLAMFVLMYIVLLPFGGYRDYRPYTIRYDTLIPVTLLLFYLYGRTTLFLLDGLKGLSLNFFIIFITGIAILFTVSDQANLENYNCEVEKLRTISSSSMDVVGLKDDCPVMEFRIAHDKENSILKAELLHKWNITSKPRLFYQEPQSEQ